MGHEADHSWGLKDQIAFTFRVSIALGAVALLGLNQFGSGVKRSIREAQQHQCADCGVETHPLQIHHKVPENGLVGNGVRGKNIKENGVGLCPADHQKWDRLALEKQIIFPGIPLVQTDKNLYTTLFKRK